MFCLVDVADQDLLNSRGWYIKEGYVCRNYGKRPNRVIQRLHVLIAERVSGEPLPCGYVVHHIDGNRLNNCRSNLQVMPRVKHIRIHQTGTNKPWLSERNRKNLGKQFPFMARDVVGDKNPHSKIADADWLWGIEELFKGNFKNNAALARYFGVKRTQVSFVLTGKSRPDLQPQILELAKLYGRM